MKSMTKQILCDTDFFVALLIDEDSNFEKAKRILDENLESIFLYSNLTRYELMTVLSRKLPQPKAIEALELFQDTFTDEFEFDDKMDLEIVEFYKNSKNKNQSYFDIACLLTAQKLNCKIASFDKFYPSEILI
jgi:predicted nucleic acid-binding protein